MQTETQRLLIRDVKTEDEIPFVQMAADGSLNDCGFDHINSTFFFLNRRTIQVNAAKTTIRGLRSRNTVIFI